MRRRTFLAGLAALLFPGRVRAQTPGNLSHYHPYVALVPMSGPVGTVVTATGYEWRRHKGQTAYLWVARSTGEVLVDTAVVDEKGEIHYDPYATTAEDVTIVAGTQNVVFLSFTEGHDHRQTEYFRIA